MSVPGPSTSTAHGSQMTNYARIGHAAQQLFPDILQEVIATKEPQNQLYGDVSSNRYLSRNCRADEWVMINNVRTNGYISFDVPLIYKLIRNLNLVPPPTNGWDYPTPPTPTELLPGDDIERIRRTRNEILHRGNANVPDNELSDYFSVFKDIAERLEVYLGKPHGAFVTRFEVLKSCCIDEKTEKEYLDRLQILVEKEKKLSKLVEDLQKNVGKLMYKDMHKLEVAEWEEQNKLFIKTEAVDYVIQSLKDKPCCTVTGTSGVGKSATIHHTALYLRDTEGYLIFPCHCPSDIEKYFLNDRKQVFIIDDICGRYTAIQTDVEEWMKWSVSIDRVMKTGHVKLLASCRLQVFNEKQFQRLKLFVDSSCNLSSEPFLLSVEQKVQIALQYLSEDTVGIIKSTLDMYDFLPLMFALFKARCERNEFVEADTFFRNPFDKYKEEVDELKNLDDKTKYCALFLLVINNGFIDVSSFTSEESYSKKKIRKEIFEVCGISRSTLRERIIEQLESLVNLFVKESFVGGNGKAYTTIHDKTFDFLCCYFGENLQKPFIKFSDRRILLERTQLVSVRGQKEEFSVSIDEENEDAYFERVLNDLINLSPTELFYSKQMLCQEFRSKLINYMRLDNERVKQMIIPNAISESKITFSYNEDGCAGRLPVSSLHLAFKLEYMDIALFLLEQIKDASADNFSLLLNKAASFGDNIIVEILLNKGTNPNNTDEIEWSPLMTACNFGHSEIVDLLLKNHANVNTTDDFDWSPLMRACGNGNEKIVKILIEKGADLTKTDNYGMSALMLATENNHKSIVDILLNYSAITYTINNKRRSPLILACEKGNIEIIRSLVNKGADVDLTDVYGGTPFTSAFNKFGDENILKLLIDKDININDPDIIRHSLLTLACERSKSEIVDFLIQKGVDVNVSDSNGNTPLFVACNKNNAKIVKLLVDKCEISTKIVKLLIDKGISNVNVAGRNDDISLILTCKGNTDKIVKLILDKGANVNVVDSDAVIPLSLACWENNDEIVKITYR